MWRPRDRERFIGSYDPEHEMPDPDRMPGERWQSDAYRHHFRDSRFAYRMNPDRFEDRFDGRRDVDREMEMRWNRDARDRDAWNEQRYGGGWERGGSWDRGPMRGGPGPSYGYGSGYGSRMSGGGFDRDRMYGSDRGWDYDRERMQGGRHFRDAYEADRGGYGDRGYGDRDRGYDDRDLRDRWGRGPENPWDRDDDWYRRR